MTGEWPSTIVDHKNRIRSDNRWENLRTATRSENGINSQVKKNNTSGFKGVHKLRDGGYVARIGVNKERKYLGYFYSAEEAGCAYDKAAEELFGEFNPNPLKDINDQIFGL